MIFSGNIIDNKSNATDKSSSNLFQNDSDGQYVKQRNIKKNQSI